MPKSSFTIIEVAIPVRIDQTFSYRVPERLAGEVAVGKRVLVPFGRRKVTGYVLGAGDATTAELKDIIEVLDAEPLVTPAELAFLRWVASYYLFPLGEVLKTALPAGINLTSRQRQVEGPDGNCATEEVLAGGRRVKTELFYRALPAPAGVTQPRGRGGEILAFLAGMEEAPAHLIRQRFGTCAPQLKRLRELGLVAAAAREVYRDPFREEVFEHDTPLVLNDDQAVALARLTEACTTAAFAPFLLYGVTGSGKTEVYLQTIAHVLSRGKTALVLVPEIALTPQLVRRFKRRFRCGIAVLHSGLSDGERFDEWRRIRRGEAEIVIGARSAIFAPLERIGIIVVDEEHEGSYKQSEGVRYHARDLALVRGKMEKGVVLLGSATPLVTSFHAAREGRLGYLELPRRVRDLPMPTVELVDARGKKGETFLPPLAAALAENLAAGGQSLLFLNRRGFATYLVCQECGFVLRCPNCAVTLTYHRRRERHFCHYCDYSIPAPSICPGCNSPSIGLLGRGTERVEEEVRELLPEARVSRMDRDTTSGRGGHARILRGLEEGRIDILIGTQMIAKGHDFPGVTLVGVVSADATLNIPDFRSAERTFQLITQVLGRAGRGDAPGRVIVQSLAPDHYAIRRAVSHDVTGFYEEELAFRRETGYPPFAFLATLHLSSTNGAVVEQGAEQAARLLQQLKGRFRSRVEILGPVTSPLGKLRGRFRWQILLKAPTRSDLHRLVNAFRSAIDLPAQVRLVIDIDPVEMM